MYQRLKERCLRQLVRESQAGDEGPHHARHRSPIRGESVRRMRHVERIQREGAQLWAADIWNWTKLDCNRFIADRGCRATPWWTCCTCRASASAARSRGPARSTRSNSGSRARGVAARARGEGQGARAARLRVGPAAAAHPQASRWRWRSGTIGTTRRSGLCASAADRTTSRHEEVVEEGDQARSPEHPARRSRCCCRVGRWEGGGAPCEGAEWPERWREVGTARRDSPPAMELPPRL
jgi:hypothetical protein